MKKLLCMVCAIIFAVTALIPDYAFASVVMVDKTFRVEISEDTYTFATPDGNYNDTNYGLEGDLNISSSSWHREGFLKVDYSDFLSSLSEDSTVKSVSLNFFIDADYGYNASTPRTRKIDLCYVPVNDWSEMTLTYNQSIEKGMRLKTNYASSVTDAEVIGSVVYDITAQYPKMWESIDISEHFTESIANSTVVTYGLGTHGGNFSNIKISSKDTTLTDNEGKITKPYIEIVVSMPSGLFMQGENYVALLQGQEYREPGYYAVGLNGEDATDSVIVEQNIDVNTPGIYFISYSYGCDVYYRIVEVLEAVETELNLPIAEDTYIFGELVKEGSVLLPTGDRKDMIYNSETPAILEIASANWHREAFLKVDFSDMLDELEDNAIINSAALWVYVKTDYGYNKGKDRTFDVCAVDIPSSDWSETTLTYTLAMEKNMRLKNNPALTVNNNTVGSVTYTPPSTTISTVNQWFSVDITEDLKNRLPGNSDNILTYGIGTHDTSMSSFVIASKDEPESTLHPYVKVKISRPADNTSGKDLDIKGTTIFKNQIQMNNMVDNLTSLDAGDSLYIVSSLNNNTSGDISPILVAIIYKDGFYKDFHIATTDVPIEPNGGKAYENIFTVSESGDYVIKLFAWDAINTLKPLTGVVYVD